MGDTWVSAAAYEAYVGRWSRLVAADFLDWLAPAAGRRWLDVGCGTGALLHRARQAGHAGRLCGVDPDRAMLGLARRRADVEWVDGTAASMAWDGAFALVTMTGHAFQVFIDDDELRASLAAIRRALAGGGRFAFETRNSRARARAWESWTPQNGTDVVDPAGRAVHVWHEVESVAGDVVTLTETTSGPDGTPLRVDRASLRFLDVDALAGFLAAAGFEIERLTYTNASIAPLVAAVRLMQRLPGHRESGREISIPPAPLNAALTAVLALEAAALRWVDMPFGSSLLALARRPGAQSPR